MKDFDKVRLWIGKCFSNVIENCISSLSFEVQICSNWQIAVHWLDHRPYCRNVNRYVYRFCFGNYTTRASTFRIWKNTISWFSDATIMRQRNAYISATVQTRIWWTNVSLHCSRDKRCPSIIDESFFLNVKNLCEIVESDFENFDICHSSQTL